MAGDIYSKAGADAAFVHDTSEGRQALAQSPEITGTFVAVRTADHRTLPAGTIVLLTLDKTLAQIAANPVADIADITFTTGA